MQQYPPDNDSSMQARRLRLGLTLRDLEKRCAEEGAPVHNSQLSKIERGLVRSPRPKTRATLAKILNLDPLEIGGELARETAPAADVAVQLRNVERADEDDMPEVRR